MNYQQKKQELSDIIESKLDSMIGSKYVLYGLPYYTNAGDTFIWEGEKALLKQLKRKCVGVCGYDSFPHKQLDPDVTILITGGGFFGDLWRNAFENVLSEIKLHPDNKIIFLPNSTHYQDSNYLKSDIELLGSFSQLTICVRDKSSYDFAISNFKNTVELVPDMAFYMPDHLLNSFRNICPTKDNLLFQRIDKEAVNIKIDISGEYDISDWTTMESGYQVGKTFNGLYPTIIRIYWRYPQLGLKLLNSLYDKCYRPNITSDALKQLANYKTIYSTRLHAMIGAMLIGRQVYFIDNSYGKLGNLYTTWLEDCESVQPFDI